MPVDPDEPVDPMASNAGCAGKVTGQQGLEGLAGAIYDHLRDYVWQMAGTAEKAGYSRGEINQAFHDAMNHLAKDLAGRNPKDDVDARGRRSGEHDGI